MSNEDNSHFGKVLPVVPHAPTFSSNKAEPLNAWPDVFMPWAQPVYTGKLSIFGVEVDSPDELAALVRDARRFRKLVRFSDGKWGTTFNGMPLEQLADALPEVES